MTLLRLRCGEDSLTLEQHNKHTHFIKLTTSTVSRNHLDLTFRWILSLYNSWWFREDTAETFFVNDCANWFCVNISNRLFQHYPLPNQLAYFVNRPMQEDADSGFWVKSDSQNDKCVWFTRVDKVIGWYVFPKYIKHVNKPVGIVVVLTYRPKRTDSVSTR